MTRRKDGPRILTLDIETFPILAHLWDLWEANALDVISHSIICTFSAKWLRGKQTTMALPDYKGYRVGSEDDKALITHIWKLLDEADIVVWQNGDKFDRTKINARFIKHGLGPPTPYKTVDTLKEARKTFGFPSKKLDAMGEYMGIGRKVHTGGFKLWQDCMKGDPSAWRKMKVYCAQDVRLTEAVYLRFLPWIKTHPNVGMWSHGLKCPKCGSQRLVRRGTARNATTEYPRFQCRSCGGWLRGAGNIRTGRPMVNA